ncbi:MAG: hypothetical protein NVS9B15_01860 [Acidobacteriaceae bacterium]
MSVFDFGNGSAPADALSQHKSAVLDLQDADRELWEDMYRFANWFTWVTLVSILNVLILAIRVPLKITFLTLLVGMYLPAALIVPHLEPLDLASAPLLLGAAMLIASCAAAWGGWNKKLWATYLALTLYLADTAFLVPVVLRRPGDILVIALAGHVAVLVVIGWCAYSATKEHSRRNVALRFLTKAAGK